jgi:hypothetical protein
MRRVEADAELPVQPIDRLLTHSRDLGGRRHQRNARLILRPRYGDRQCMRGGDAGAPVQQGLDLRIEGIASPLQRRVLWVGIAPALPSPGNLER